MTTQQARDNSPRWPEWLLTLLLAGYFFGITAFYTTELSPFNPLLGIILLLVGVGVHCTGQARLAPGAWLLLALLGGLVVLLWLELIFRSPHEQRLIMAVTYQYGVLLLVAATAHRISPRVFLGIVLGGLTVLLPLPAAVPALGFTAALRGATLYGDAINVLAAMLPVAAGVTLWLADDAERRGRPTTTLALLAAAAVILFCVVMIGARQSLLATLPWLLMLCFLRRWRWLAVAGLGLTLLFVALLLLDQNAFVLVRWQGLLAFFGQGADTGEGSTTVRVMLILHGARAWLDAPLLGHGIMSFGEATGLGHYAHNNYIEMLFGLGLVGFLLFHLPVLLAVVRGGLAALQKNAQARWGALMLGAGGYILVQGMFIITFPRHIVWVCLMLIIYCWRRLDRPGEN